MSETMHFASLMSALRRRPDAEAVIRGSADYPAVSGRVRFYQTGRGVLVVSEVSGLPETGARCAAGVFGFHIHSGSRCSGDSADPFAVALTHYDPSDCPHPAHAGDLPPLFSNRGCAFGAVLTDRFTVREIVGRTVIVHARPDDFTSQPAGMAGEKIACGQIRGPAAAVERRN